MRSYTRYMLLTMAIFTVICCNKAVAQLASEKPVASFYSRLVKEKLAEKQKNRTMAPAATPQLPSEKALPRQAMEAAEKRRKKG